MKQYSRVTYEVRCQIYAFLQAGLSFAEIARITGFHRSTISRELKRNSSRSPYLPSQAHELARSRYRLGRSPYKMCGNFRELIEEKLHEGWSPEQISGRLKVERKGSISHECIYQLVRKNREYYAPRMRRMRVHRGYHKKQIRHKHLRPDLKIEDRPKIVNQRKRRGDWERDTMLMKNRKPILVCVERKTKYMKLGIAESQTSDVMNRLTKTLLKKTGQRVYTMTNDRGHEFRKPMPCTRTYYCDPQSPQQRGTVENSIGLLRQYAKTTIELKDLTANYINNLEKKMNFRPRKCLNYLTPHEAFFNKKVALVT